MSVSVVIPAYNAEACLHEALASVFAQTVPVDEIIVVDDGSSDRTSSITAFYGRRIRLMVQRNQGASAARNHGVRVASSDRIAFLDADDSWDKHKIEQQLAAFEENPTAVLCYTGLLNHLEDGSEAVQCACPLKSLASALRIGNPSITPSCVMLSRAAFLEAGGFDLGQKVCEDWDLWLRLLQLGPFCVVDKPLTHYSVSSTGLSSNAEELFDEAVRMLDRRLLSGLDGVSRALWRRRILSYQRYKSALTARSGRQQSREISHILHSFLLWPSPLWHPERMKVFAVTLRNAVR